MITIKLWCQSFVNKIKSLSIKDILKILGVSCLMCLCSIAGSALYGFLGAGCGLGLGYICGKLILFA